MEKILKMMSALGEKNRLRIFMVLLEHKDLCVCQLAALLGLAMPTVSRHTSILREARLVQSRKSGRWVHFSIADSIPELLVACLKESLGDSEQVQDDRKKVAMMLCGETNPACMTER